MLVEVDGVLEEHPARDLLVKRNGKWVGFDQEEQQRSHESVRGERKLPSKKRSSYLALLKRCYPLRPAPKAEQVRGSRYCMVCHRPCRRSPCVKCGRPTLLNE